MAAYAPHDILRRIDNALIAEYAAAKGLFPDLEIGALKQTDIQPVYQAMQALDAKTKEAFERDLRSVATLAEKRHIHELFKALKHNDIAFPEFHKKRDNYDKAMWALLHYPDIFGNVLKYSFPYTELRHWQRFKLPSGCAAATDQDTCERLRLAIMRYFQEHDGRGAHCFVQHNCFQDYDYFFAYPSEYPEQVPEWLEDGTFERMPHRLAFMVIFVMHKGSEAVDMYLTEQIAVKRALFDIWTKEVLGLSGVASAQKPSFDLSGLINRAQPLVIPEDSPVKSLAVYKLRFAPSHNPKATYTIEIDPTVNKQAAYDELAKKSIEIEYTKSIGLEAIFHSDDGGKEKKLRFEISQSSCSLKHTDQSAILRKLLKSAGIDVSA